MFTVGDKVQIADNIESAMLRGMPGTVIQIDPLKVMYPFQVEFENGSVLYFSSDELTEVGQTDLTQLERIERKLDRILSRVCGEYMAMNGTFKKGVL